MTGLWLWANCFGDRLYCLLSVYISASNSTVVGHFISDLNLWNFRGFKLGFHGHVGPCRICRLCSDIILVVYIYIYVVMQLILVLQVAVGWFCVCLFLSLVCFDLG